jgi:histidinol-phosphate/aromatic aminotransferase/cobyric acid decarboxylase-like protein
MQVSEIDKISEMIKAMAIQAEKDRQRMDAMHAQANKDRERLEQDLGMR